MRGRQSIGFELGADVLEILVFPQAVEEKFVQLRVSACGLRPEGQPMEAKLVGKVILFPPSPSSISISYIIMCDIMYILSYI